MERRRLQSELSNFYLRFTIFIIFNTVASTALGFALSIHFVKMAQRIRLLVQWMDGNELPSYSIVKVNSVKGDKTDLRIGKMVCIQNKYEKDEVSVAKIIKISDNKNYLKKKKSSLEKEDKRLKNVVTTCMRTLKAMSGSSVFNINSAEPSNSKITNDGHKIDKTDTVMETSSSSSDTEPERDRATSKYSKQALEIYFNSLRTENTTSTKIGSKIKETPKRQRTMVCSTPVVSEEHDIRLHHDKGTQTDTEVVIVSLEKVLQLEDGLNKLYEYMSSMMPSDDNIDALTESLHEHSEATVADLSGTTLRIKESEELEINNQNEAKPLEVRRVSAQTTNAADSLDMVPIGLGNAKIPARIMNEIDWTSYTTATRQLLQAVFPRKVLATHSLTGKRSPAFLTKPPKKCLDVNLVNDIVDTVAEKCDVPKRLVRGSITTKCTDESKLYRNRLQTRSNRHQTDNHSDENVPPVTPNSNIMQSTTPSSEESMVT